MKALTLHQPWASLMALKVKTIETRSWKAPANAVGERVLIHAGARQVHTGKFLLLSRIARTAGAITADAEKHFRALDVPFGAAVASGVLAACVPIVTNEFVRVSDGRHEQLVAPGSETPDGLFLFESLLGEDGERRLWTKRVLTSQLPYGDFTPGRYAWLFDHLAPVTERCPACWGHCSLGMPGAPGECETCGGTGSCVPFPARGKQRLWNWNPAVSEAFVNDMAGATNQGSASCKNW